MFSFLFSGDIESNPGPLCKTQICKTPVCKTSDDPLEQMKDNIDLHGDEVVDMKEAVDNQNKILEELFTKLNELSAQLDTVRADNKEKYEKSIEIQRVIEDERKLNISEFEKLKEDDSKLDKELEDQKVKKLL